MKKAVILLFMTYMQFIPAFGQNYEPLIKKITDPKGNSASGTFAVVEDERGFIWFGTVEGLYRFDGYNFKKFRYIEDVEGSLSGNTIRALCLMNDKLWIGTQGGGLNCLDLKTEKITKYIRTGESENEIINNSVWSLLKDSKGNIWIGTEESGICKLDPKTKDFKLYHVTIKDYPKKYDHTVRALYEDTDGMIWAGIAGYGLVSLDPQTGEYKNYFHAVHEKDIYNSTNIRDICEDEQGNLLLATYGGGINIFNKEKDQFVEFIKNTGEFNSLVSDLCYCITKDKNGTYWIATEYGISVWDRTNNRFNNYVQNTCIPNSLSDNRVRKIFIDSNGIIWIGTESDVNMIIRQENFLLHKNIPGDLNSLPKGIVRTILEDNDGNLWFGLIDYGLVFYDRKEKLYTTYTKFRSSYYKDPKKHITALYQDSNNDIWLGEWDSGIYKLNGSTGVFEQKATDSEGRNILTGTMIQKILEDKPGCLWIGTEFGLNYYNAETNENIQIVHSPENSNSLSGNAVQSNAVIKDHKGNLWVGVWSGGLNKISFPDSHINDPVFENWRNDPTDPKSLANDNVISLFYDEGDILWIGTFGGGLSKLNIPEEAFTHYTTADGLPNNIVYSIIKDDTGFLWLSTDGGLSRFNPETGSFKNYYRSDGLQSDHFFWGSSHAGKSGRIYFGGIKGVNSFYPDSIFEKEIQTPVVLLSLKIFDKEYIISDPDTNNIDLKYNENFLTFEFAALNYINPHHVQYYYMTEGIDADWINNGNRRFANYTDLAPGTYTFKVSISEGDIPDVENQLSMKFVIHPPWWATWWARTFTLVFIIGAVIAFYYIRIGILERQKRRLKDIVEKRTAEINESKNELAKKNTELTNTLNKLELAQKALVESEKMASIGIMSAGIAHEINNPLNFISVSTENIKMLLKNRDNEAVALDEDQMKIINKLIDHSETGINRISNIVKSLKTYAHKGESKSTEIQMKEIIESALTILHSKIPENIHFDYEYEDVPNVNCKPEEISQVILNLTDNALDALADETVQDKKIKITVNREAIQNKDYIVFTIFNSGNPIPKEILKHIFDPFYTTKSPNKGTGLGLYISYNIIQDHGGILKAENIPEGVKFLVYLPI